MDGDTGSGPEPGGEDEPPESRNVIYIPLTRPNASMKDYLDNDDEHRLSPVVVGSTAVLVATFALGVLYQLVGLVL